MNENEKYYRFDIDGLRAIAVISVLIYHCFPSFMPGGFIGVDIFFVISGYLITQLITKEITQDNFSFSSFYTRRIRRLLPALLCVLTVTLIFSYFVMYPEEFTQLGKQISASLIFIQNFILYHEGGYFDSGAEIKPLLHLWSLSIEEQFYLIYPLFVFISYRFAYNKAKSILLIGLTLTIFCSFLYKINITHFDPSAAFFQTQYRIWEIALGCLLANLPQTFKGSLFLRSNVLASFALFSLFACFFVLKDWAIISIISTMILLSQKEGFVPRILSHRYLVLIGLISYPLYLWHWPIISFGHLIFGENLTISYRLLTILLSFILAFVTYKYLEKPIRSQQDKRTTLLIILFSLTLCGTGYILFNSDGKINRKDLPLKRQNNEIVIAFSNKWFEGKEHWLFLGDLYSKTVSKLLGVTKIDTVKREHFYEQISKVSLAIQEMKTQLILLTPPNKSSLYSEYLPNSLVLPQERFIDPIKKQLSQIPKLHIYDPIYDLQRAKNRGLLYYKNDSHWNALGALVALEGLTKYYPFQIPEAILFQEEGLEGDLTKIARIKKSSVIAKDHWKIEWKNFQNFETTPIKRTQKSSFGKTVITHNPKAKNQKRVWVTGDSFNHALRPYLTQAFMEVTYLGHSYHVLDQLPELLQKSKEKPDLILIIKTERTFW